MRILGIDPGSITCGYGLIQKNNLIHAEEIRYIASGRIVASPKKDLHLRLKELYSSLTDLLSELKPDEIAVEKIFYAKGVKAALSLGHARGVVLLAASLTGKPIFQYSPLEVKKAVVGYGRADKQQVQRMVREILKIKNELSSDSADAIALALCHANGR
jgi:crossover junction endodeoxyribonuclease RuvC